LKDLAQDLLQMKKLKSNGKWTKNSLSVNQIKYATMDAWLSYKLTKVLYDALVVDKTNINFHKWCCKNLVDESEVKEEYVNTKKRKRDMNKFDKQRKQLYEYRKQTGYYRKKLEHRQRQVTLMAESNNSIDEMVKMLKQTTQKQ
jgi:ribonuclease D